MNELVLVRDDYESDFEYDRAILSAVKLLTEARYILTVELEEKNIFVIRYDHANRDYGTPYPYWLTPEAAERLERECECDD